MKYTKYLIEGNIVNMNSFQTKNIYLKLPAVLISIPVALVAIITITGMIPMAFMVDEARNTKARMIHFKRSGYKF
jgi:hypothetical protein